MRRLYFTLSRRSAAARSVNSRSKDKSDCAPSCSFEELANLIDPEPDHSTVWRKAVDRENKVLLFYQLDLGGDEPKFAKCVCIRPELFQLGKHSEVRLVPSAFLAENDVPEEDDVVQKILPLAPHISSVMDVVKLLQYVELFPHVPDDECVREEVQQPTVAQSDRTVDFPCDNDAAVVGSLNYGDCEPRDMDDADCDYAPSEDNSSADSETNDGEKSTGSKRQPKPGPELNDSQIAYADLVKQYLRQPDGGKQEIYPGAGIYAPRRILEKTRTRYLPKTQQRRVKRMAVHIPAAHFAIDLMDSLGKFTNKLPFKRADICEIFDNEFLTKIAEFVNLNHGGVVNGERPPLDAARIIRAIMSVLRHKNYVQKVADKMAQLGHRSQYLMKKELNLLPPQGKRAKQSGDNQSHSLIPPIGDAQLNPLLPYNHPDFRPSYLFPRPGYVPLWLLGDDPPVYIQKTDLEYFCSEQSHTDYPESSRWIRALCYKIFDEQTLLHMCYLHRKQQLQPGADSSKVLFASVVSKGFLKMLDEFTRNSGRLLEDVGFLALTVGYWFKDYKRTVLKKGLLTDDPSLVKVTKAPVTRQVRKKRKK
ncbi:uncharacterized protein LOC129594312 [Paramacrobiotus metropolitanus]|uniref:uncharacterized protein LOC129594312 n=1 Tax=Paramacrobiotus metropolitanus TaxID=2943436 RepID=UPI0024458FA2|nr:uncharacterized protein LOC129594312 [Paramacrobiotus metropolitanus]